MYAGKILVSILGDSLSTFEGYNPPGYSVFYDKAVQKRNGLQSVYDTWWAKVNQYLHACLCVNDSYSGSQMAGQRFPSGCSFKRLSALCTEKYMPDIILVYLGYNDFGRGVPVMSKGLRHNDCSFFYDAYLAALAEMEKMYPKTKIICGTLMRTYLKDNMDWVFPDCFGSICIDEYNEAIRKACRVRKCMVADLADTGIRYETLDGSHATVKGHKTIAETWVRCLKPL